MLILSPTKNLKRPEYHQDIKPSAVLFPEKANKLANLLKQFSAKELSQLMNMSDKLGELNYKRFQNWQSNKNIESAIPAILGYSGEVFNGLNAATLTADQLRFANNHVRILSGMYGVLRPLDGIQPYRLEMATKLQVDKYKNLYEYWGDLLCDHLNATLNKSPNKILINLASNEYSKAAKLNKVNGSIITPVFKQLKGEHYKVITIYAKKARGLMTRFIIENAITEPEQLKLFDPEGYFYNEPLSSETEWVFTR